MSTLNDFDINELVLQLHSELKFAFGVANAAEKQSGLQLETVKASLGRKNIPDDGGNGDNLSILNSDRYPDEEDWEIQVSYKYGDPLPGVPQSQNWVNTTESQLILERLGKVQIIKIKGVSNIWKRKLASQNIVTIEDMALASTEKILSMCQQFKSMAPLEFQTKVLLLVRDFNPIIYPQFKDIALHSLLNNNRTNLKRMFLGKLSGPEISSLQAMASIVFLVLDKSFTSKLKLELLSK